jgi:purine-binding chemotaxis protein CheW
MEEDKKVGKTLLEGAVEAFSVKEEEGTAEDVTIQILSFSLADEWYGIRINLLREIVRYGDVTPVPFTPDYLAGIINLRGTIIPVVDLKKVFGLDVKEPDSDTRILILKREEMEVGIEADSIAEVLEIPVDSIEPPLSTMEKIKAEFIEGEVQLEKGILILLNAAAVIDELKLNR